MDTPHARLKSICAISGYLFGYRATNDQQPRASLIKELTFLDAEELPPILVLYTPLDELNSAEIRDKVIPLALEVNKMLDIPPIVIIFCDEIDRRNKALECALYGKRNEHCLQRISCKLWAKKCRVKYDLDDDY